MKASQRALADAYNRKFPGTGISEAQAAEREDRIRHKEERVSHRRTGRVRGIVVPPLPWMSDEEDE